jgi:hypothetical protein
VCVITYAFFPHFSMRAMFSHSPYATRDEFALMTYLALGAVLFTIVATAIYLYAQF